MCEPDLHKLFQYAIEVNDHGGGASLAAALDRNIMHGAQLAGEWQPGPSVQDNVEIFNIPRVASRALSEWILAQVADSRRHIALLAPTTADVRAVTVEGPSGILVQRFQNINMLRLFFYFKRNPV